MSEFIETTDGHLIPVSNISRIIKRKHSSPKAGGDSTTTHIMTKDDHEFQTWEPTNLIASRSRPLIPASPGWSVLYYEAKRDGEPEFVIKTDAMARMRK
jgi:hypothetical protein